MSWIRELACPADARGNRCPYRRNSSMPPAEAAHRRLPDQPAHELAVNLRRTFSGIVAGNVKEDGIRAVEQHGPFEIRADGQMLAAMDELLQRFVEQRRMKLQGEYTPCYTLVR